MDDGRVSETGAGRVSATGRATGSFLSTGAGFALSLDCGFITASRKFANEAAIAALSSSVVSGVSFAGEFIGESGIAISVDAIGAAGACATGGALIGADTTGVVTTPVDASGTTARGAIASPGKLMPQNPGAGCVNSSST
jgi:hypothetical protein